MGQVFPITVNGYSVDLSSRMVSSTTVVASPALAAETIICTVVTTGNIQIESGIKLAGWVSITIGTSGTTLQLRLRRTSVSGTLVVAGPAEAVSAGSVYMKTILGFDSGAPAGTTYELTAQVANGAAASTVAACQLDATVI